MLYSQLWLSRLIRVGVQVSFAHLGVLLALNAVVKGFRNLGSITLEDAVAASNLFIPETGIVSAFPLLELFISCTFNHLTVFIFIGGFIQTWVMASIAEVSRIYPTTRRESFLNVLGSRSSGSVWYIVLIGLSSACLCHCYMTSVGLGTMDVVPKTGGFECPGIGGPSSICWNAQYIVIISFSALFSAYVFYLQYRELNFLMTFPTIDLPVGYRVKRTFYQALMDSWKQIMYFAVFNAAMLIVKTLGFMASSMYLSNVLKFGILFNLAFFINLVIWPSFVVYSTKLCWRLVEVTLTQTLDLPVESKYPNSTTIVTLSDAMKSEELPMKYLGFYELNLRSCTPRTSDDIRQFFNLSHPGRHPRSWMGVLDATLNECSDLTKALNNYTKNCRRGGSVPFKPALYSATLIPQSENGSLRRKTLAHTQMRDLAAPIMPPVPQNPSPRNVLSFTPEILRTALQRMLNHMWNSQIAPKVNRVKSFANEKDSQRELANILSSAQLIIWGSNSIVEISSVSFVHDNHGIVQRDMQRIISVFLNLYDALIDVIQLSTPFNHAPPPANSKIPDALLRQLITCVSFNLSRLHRGFCSYYDILGIPKTHGEKLQELSKSKQANKYAAPSRAY